MAKVAIFVLLSAALILSCSATHPTREDIEDSVAERNINEAWDKLSAKFSQAVDKIKAAWEEAKSKGKKIAEINVQKFKATGQKLIEETKKIYKEVVIESKDATAKFQELYKAFEKFRAEIKNTTSMEIFEAVQLVQEAVYAVKQNLAALTKH